VIVVDSSVWINLTRNVDSPGVSRLENRLKTKEILVGDLILVEVLQGCRTQDEVRRTERLLGMFETDTMAGWEAARRAAENYRHLRKRGITIRSTIDVMIATYCIDRGYGLLTEDQDFVPMAQHLELRLA
jgi:predicted nucleic acid-binding protein